jgi:hypothetical protein
MDMYNSHLRGLDRKLAVFDADMENQINKLATMYEMASLKSNQIYKDIETKVYLEGYDTTDMTYMYQEASEESIAKKKGILKKIFEWFAKIFKAIKEKIAGVFHKDGEDEEYEVPSNTFKVVDAIEKHFKSIKMALVKIKSGNFAGGFADLVKAVLPEVVFIATSVIIVKKTPLLDALKKLKKTEEETEDVVDGAESQTKDLNDDNAVDDAQKSLSLIQRFIQMVSTAISEIAKFLATPIRAARGALAKGAKKKATRGELADVFNTASAKAAKNKAGSEMLDNLFDSGNKKTEESVYDYFDDDDDYSFYY